MSAGRDTFRWSWKDHVPCKHKTDLFYAPYQEPEGERRRRILAALALCSQCPHRPECKNEADARGEDHGIWGGEPRQLEPKMPTGERKRKAS